MDQVAVDLDWNGEKRDRTCRRSWDLHQISLEIARSPTDLDKDCDIFANLEEIATKMGDLKRELNGDDIFERRFEGRWLGKPFGQN